MKNETFNTLLVAGLVLGAVTYSFLVGLLIASFDLSRPASALMGLLMGWPAGVCAVRVGVEKWRGRGTD